MLGDSNHGHGARAEHVEPPRDYDDDDPPMTFAQAARRLPGRTDPSAVWRWAREGLKARNGHRVFLKVARVGRRMFVKLSDLRAFFDAIDAMDREHFAAKAATRDARSAAPVTPAPRSEARRAKDIARAEKELARRGV